MEDDFALRYARIYPGVNSRADFFKPGPGLGTGLGISYTILNHCGCMFSANTLVFFGVYVL